MSITNFALDSDFRWLLLAPAIIWLAGLVLHVTGPRNQLSARHTVVTGTRPAFEFLQRSSQFQTATISPSIRQDILRLTGSEDHYVPRIQWPDQMRVLQNARSITARLFTRTESAQSHWQVGNYGLALRTIVGWLDEKTGARSPA
jgi:hypothetical protein